MQESIRKEGVEVNNKSPYCVYIYLNNLLRKPMQLKL